ncbi:MAG: hypothetical protein KDI50_00525 [Candidatus Competibacteraceae bacterium]|nr:hypothetical protein [Candidatus Competibacteraceae bacterium]
MKSHIAAEIDALSLPMDQDTLVCPAIPYLGCHVVSGSCCRDQKSAADRYYK